MLRKAASSREDVVMKLDPGVESSFKPEHRGAGGASRRSLLGLDWLNFFLADVQTGIGRFIAVYLQQNKWNPEQIGLALTAGGIAGIVTQTPAGALIDRMRSKRLLIAIGILAVAAGSLVLSF